MDEKPRQPPHGIKRTTSAILATVLLVPLLYALSIGPVYRLIEEDAVSNRIAHIYRPLILLAEKFDAVGDGLIWYLSLWAKDDP